MNDNVIQRTIEYIVLALVGNKKYRTIKGEKSSNKMTDYQQFIRHLDMSIFFLCYTLRHEDMMLSPDEVNIITKQIEAHDLTIKDADRKRLENYMRRELTNKDILVYLKKREVSAEELTQIFKLLDKVAATTKRHRRVIGSLISYIYENYGVFEY